MSEVRVNKLSPRSGTTVTLGDSGDTITIPSGVTFDASSGGLAGTLTTAAQPNITSVGTLTSFASTGIDDNATSTAITIDSSERVGIGTASPISSLTVNSGSNGVGLFYGNTGNNYIEISDNNNTNKVSFGSLSGGNAYLYSGSGKYTALYSGGSERMRIDSSGNVGIGTSSPASYKLNVNGISNFSGNSNWTSGSELLWNGGDIGITNSGTNIVFKTFLPGNYGERVRIDSNGNVGIGTSSPGTKLQVESSGTTVIRITAGTSNDSQINFGDPDDGDVGMINYDHAGNSMKFVTNTLEAMRIDTGGRLLVGATSVAAGTNGSLYIETNAVTERNLIALNNTDTGATSSGIVAFYRNASFTGGISHTNTTTAYNTSSDYRLKENVSYDFDATTRLKQLRPARFNFIADANTTVDGFLAHEVSSVVPEAITGTKDAVDENGNPVYQGIDQSKLVPLLVKTIQELEARITALETQP
jgi:hypothetical protein